MVRRGFFTNEDLARVSHTARLTFIGLWCLADRKGLLEDRPARIRAELFPYEPRVRVVRAIDELAALRFVVRYEVDGEKYLWIPKFTKQQHIHPDEARSRLPEPPGGFMESPGIAGEVSESQGTSASTSASTSTREARGWRRVPPEERLTPERLAEATRLGLTLPAAKLEWDKFVDHDFAAPRRDVDATWRNWCRRARELRGGITPPPLSALPRGNPQLDAIEAAYHREMAELAAEGKA